MDSKTLKTLDYYKILEQLRAHAATVLGKQLCSALTPSSDLEQVKQRLAATDEAAAVMRLGGGASFAGIRHIDDALKRAKIGGVLSAQQCLDVKTTLEGGRRLKRSLLSLHHEHALPIIASLCEQLTVQRALEQDIATCISDDAEVLDSASDALRKIRAQIRTGEARIRERLEQMIRTPSVQKKLQDNIITMRNGRYVLPVKQGYRAEFSGMIHDQSASGATLFIEPQSIVNMNNQLQEAMLQEQAEIEKILMALTMKIAEVSEMIEHNVQVLAELDFIFAKASLANAMEAALPKMNERGFVQLKQGRHPLIPAVEVVPIDVELGADNAMIIVTGPNTGGKTVTLKTIGLLSLMAMSGLFIPAADGSEMCVFDGVYADIGDEQSIEQNLSTFSSHMTNIIRIIEHITPQSLVLLDELGAGTDPAEGSALAISILEHLRRIGCRVVATTHFSELKSYAYEQEGIMNASMEFDIRTLSPTYRLLIGIPGRSNAFAIAERLGLSPTIISQAKQRMAAADQQIDTMIASLEANRLTSEAERETAEQLRKEWEAERRALEEERRKFVAQRDKLMEQAEAEAHAIVNKARQEADAVIAELRQMAMEEQASIKEHRLIAARKQLEQAEPTEHVKRRRKGGKRQRVEPGDEVFVATFGQKGHVIEVISEQEALVQLGIMKMKVDTADLDVVTQPKQKTVATGTRVKRTRGEQVRTELDLRGAHLEEALLEVDQFLDDAVLAYLSQVQIIHGKGTGVLREGIQQHLSRHKLVKHFRLGEFGEGGTGVTVITLK